MAENRILKSQEVLSQAANYAPIIETFGMKLSYNEDNEAVWTLPFTKSLTNGVTIHGGAIATLLDCAGWFTLSQYYENWIATVDFNTNLITYAKDETLVATGHVVKIGKRISNSTMEVVSEKDGRIIATGTGTYALTSVPFPI